MKTQYHVSLVMENDDGKIYQKVVKVDSIIGVSRFLSTYKPKNGYKIVLVDVHLLDLLV